MKKYIILIIIFAVILIGAAVGYKYLSSEYENESQSDTKLSTVINEITESKPNVSNESTVTKPSETSESSTTKIEPTADFTVVDANGNSVSLSDYYGKPIVVNFWASWCTPCKIELPDFEQAYKTYGNDIHFLMVNVGDNSIKEATDFASEAGYTFPVYFDKQNQASAAYGVYSIPQTLFINADSSLEYSVTGTLSAEKLKSGINSIK